MPIYVAGWFALLAAGMPIAFTLGVVAFAYLWIEGGSMTSTPQRLFAAIDSFPLLAVPAFVLAGEIMNSGGVTRRIVDFARTLVGHIPGGLGHVNVVANVIASGMSGSALADAAGVGSLMIKSMRDEGFDAEFSGSLTAAACIIGPLIPPSIPFVIYAVMASASVGKLFLAGFVPGILTAIALMVYVYIVAGKRGYPKHSRATLRQVGHAFRKAFFALLTPVIIMGGIFGGIFTPTEAAAVTAIYALGLGLFVYRDLRLRDLPRVFRNAANTSAIIGIIVACANLVSYVLTRERIPQALAEALLGVSHNPQTILLIINVLLLTLGCFMEGLAIMILTVPVLLPVVQQLGIDPVHFGVIVVMNLMIGVLTPPFGMALFVVSRVGDIPFGDLAKGILPFIPPLIGVLLVCTYFPDLVLLLPRLVFGR
jgi:tripartite ATP-independent transporter DctM subunit